MPAGAQPAPTTVLVAIDLDAPSRAALKLARKQARLENARPLLLHVVTAAAIGPAQDLAFRALELGVDPDERADRDVRGLGRVLLCDEHDTRSAAPLRSRTLAARARVSGAAPGFVGPSRCA